MQVFQQVMQLEAAGAIGAEMEVVPDRVAAEISKRTRLILLSMGAGPGGDAQYLFAEDVLGYTRGHRPRHAKVYRNFRAEYERLQQERIAAFSEFAADVKSGAYPAAEHLVAISDDEFAGFMAHIQATA
jgi:3-methyl-2-oxobutanoate hydroxymethyltransferase